MFAHAYEYVCAIADYQNISKAAQALCITQPALTKYINRLEKDLSIRLFDRTANPVVLTEAGVRFVQKARQIRLLEAELMADLNQFTHSSHGTIRLGMGPEFCSTTLPYLITAMKQQYPNLKLKLTEGNNKQLFSFLEKGEIDFAILSSQQIPDNLQSKIIQVEPIVLAVPTSHTLCQGTDLTANSPLTPYYISPAQVKGSDFIVCNPDVGMGQTAHALFDRYHLSPHIVMEIQRNEAALRLASTGIGMVFVPVRTVLRIQLIAPMAYFSISNPLHCRNRYLCYQKDNPLSEPANCFIFLISQLFSEENALLSPVCQLLTQPSVS